MSRSVTECAHTDRPHYAKGYCQRCYMAGARLGRKVTGEPERRRQGTCLTCGETATIHAYGLCTRCYQREWRRQRAAALRRLREYVAERAA